MVYRNVDYARVDVEVTSGDTWDQVFYVKRNGAAYDMSGMQLDIDVVDDDGVVVVSLSSAGISPTITINGAYYRIQLNDAFSVTVKTKYSYDVQLTDGTKVSTIGKGYVTAVPEITT